MNQSNTPFRVAIVGGGPAGSTLAILLAELGITVVLFDDGKRPDMVVGESMIPALVPILRRLGIESEVAKMGQKKPGVSFLMAEGEPLHLSFKPLGDRLPQYAYNVPRPKFDDLMRKRVRESAAQIVPVRAKIEADPQGGEKLRLDQATLDQAPALEGHQPDLIVDSTGRRRTIARLLDLATTDGERKDLAHFAHYENFNLDGLEQGQVITGLMKQGWSWIIPLQNRVSLGVVMHRDQMRSLGSTPEQQLAGAIDQDSNLRSRSHEARRVSDVLSYANYQKVTQRGIGPNWVLLGDAFGFVDPMFSPGLFLALESAQILTNQLQRVLNRQGRPTRRAWQKALRGYESQMQGWFTAWMDLIDLIYSGNVLALREAGEQWMQRFPSNLSQRFNDHMEQQMAAMAAGQATRSKYAWFLLKSGIRFGMRDNDPGKYRIA